MIRFEIKNLVGGYENCDAVNDVSFFAKQGEMIYVLGPNGSGKTTLFNMLIGYKKRISGQILIEGVDIDKLSAIELAKCIAYIPQQHVPVFNYTVADIVIMGRTCHIKRFGIPQKLDYDIVNEMLAMLEIQSLAHREYMELSGGERQLVLIARALCQKAEIIVMDEPLTGLDFANKALVTKALSSLLDMGYTIVMSTHNAINNYSEAAKILLMNSEGKGVFGKIDDIILHNTIQQVYNTPLQTICTEDEKGGKHLLWLPV